MLRNYIIIIEKKFFNDIMIIGDTMPRVNLIDINFKNMSVEDKRVAFVLMDFTLKRLHLKNLIVTDFNPKYIYCENGLYYFEKVSSNPYYYANDKEEAILKNILSLSNLAFCSYLPEYDMSQGLFNHDIISEYFDDIATYFPNDDRNYYKSILVDSYKENKLVGDSVYYYDYIVKQNKTEVDKGNSSRLVKATEAGRALANQDEAAFGKDFFFLAMVTSITLLLVGVFVYFRIF